MMMTTSFRLRPTFAERVWGRETLEPWYSETGLPGKVGEAWLTGPESTVATGEDEGRTLREVAPEFPLLVKMLFPNEKLSVQVHPDDAEAQALGLSRGKTECWYALEAEPGAVVACGLRPGSSVAALEAAVRDGSAEDVLEWLPMSKGDMVFVDAGTVHAIGPGLVLLEVQQTCDVTYRLYDYGRPRELHLAAGLAVVKAQTAAGKVKPQMRDGFTRLIASKYFVVDRFDISAGETVDLRIHGAACVVGLAGQGTIDGVSFRTGEAVVVAPRSVLAATEKGVSFALCFEPVN
jgi:mannose-6-phosphate isomerase